MDPKCTALRQSGSTKGILLRNTTNGATSEAEVLQLTSTVSGDDARDETPLAIIAEWNRLDGFPQVVKLTAGREAAIRRIRMDPDLRDRWREALGMLQKSSFCAGDNNRGWRANLDWFLKTDSMTRLLEGFYADRATPAKAKQPSTY